MARLIIETHGGISGLTDFKIFIKRDVTFELKSFGDSGVFVCKQFIGDPAKQCYKCAFCHSVDVCNHVICENTCSDGTKELYKFKKLNYED